jgi:hypothetical protein
VRLIAPTALIACLLTTQAQAQERAVYIGAQGGQTSTDIDSAKVSAAMAERGIPGTASIEGAKDRTAWRVFGGYRLTDWLALEAGYVNLDKIVTKLTGIGPVVFDDIRDVLPVSGDGAELQLLLSYSFGQRFSVIVRGGAWRWSSQYKITQIDGESSNHRIDGIDATYGAAFDVGLTRNWRARLSWDNYKTGAEESPTYMFGLVRELR